MISPCYFIDLDTQEAFVGSHGVLASGKQNTGVFIDYETLRANLKLLSRHAVKKDWPILAPVEVYEDGAGETKILKGLPVHCKRGSKDAKKIKETAVRGALTLSAGSKGKSQKYSVAQYKKLLKKHPQIVFEKYGYDVFKNPHFLKMLKAGGIKTCVVYGAALDFGLESLVLKLLKSGFHVYIPVDAVKAINEENRRMALVELRKFGAEMWNTEFILKNT